jgi:PAS domain-containing protein
MTPPNILAERLDGRFCQVMDAAPVMIWVSGIDKRCIWFNRPWLEFTGRVFEQELGTESVRGSQATERCRVKLGST